MRTATAVAVVALTALVGAHTTAPIRTWSFLSPNRRMDWTELPLHVTVRIRRSAVIGDDREYDDTDVDVLVMAGAFGGANDTLLNYYSRVETSTSLTAPVDSNNGTAEQDDDKTRLDQTLSLLKHEIQDSPVGTLSSRVVMLRQPEETSYSESTTFRPPPPRYTYLYCLQMGSNVTTADASSQSNATTTDSDDNHHAVAATTTQLQHKHARMLGQAVASLVQLDETNNNKDGSTRSAGGKRQQRQHHKSTKLIRVVLPPLATPLAWTELATAFWTSLYSDKRYKGSSDKDETIKDKPPTPVTVEFVVVQSPPNNNNASVSSLPRTDDNDDNAAMMTRIETAWQHGAAKSRGVYMAMDIVNAPHNSLNSLSLAETAQRIAQQYPSVLTCRILNVADCERRGMGAFLGVARGSETEAQFIHMTYTPPPPHGWWRRSSSNNKLRTLGLVGKGLLFDTGGYNIKTTMMEYMKFDCGGAAAVLGAAVAIAALQPPNVIVHFCIAACENMINERAVVPSDILTASNGKTIEVMDTDAEGRLTLADALVYVDRDLKCDEIVELSTLTGACMVALGGAVAGLWTHSDKLAEELLAVSKTSGEAIWRMPLVEEYNDQLKSKIADIKNLGAGRQGGAITAALFLQHFVKGRDKPFAHIDMAGPVWSMKLLQATGWGAKLLCEWVQHKSNLQAKKED